MKATDIYQHAGIQELLFLLEEFAREWASDNQDDERDNVNIRTVGRL